MMEDGTGAIGQLPTIRTTIDPTVMMSDTTFGTIAANWNVANLQTSLRERLERGSCYWGKGPIRHGTRAAS